MSNSTPRAALPPLPQPVGRLMHYHGRDTYPKQGYTVARTWEECMKNAYVDYWREGTHLYTAEQVEQIRRDDVLACAAACQALDNPENSPEYRAGAAWCAERVMALLEDGHAKG